MSDIEKEIESIGAFVAPLNYARIWKQTVPLKYEPNQLAINFVGDDSVSETGYHYRIDRLYQLVVFEQTERACLRAASALQTKINSVFSIPIKDSTQTLRFGSFALSRPFKTQNDELYACIGMLQSEVRLPRVVDVTPPPKIGRVEVEIVPKAPVIPGPDAAPAPMLPPKPDGSKSEESGPKYEVQNPTQVKTKCGGGK